jgi:hypothetical protein
MLTALRTGTCFRLALALAGFAVLCFVAPPAALAFGHGGSVVHCLTHADGVNHDTGLTAEHHSHGQGANPAAPAEHHPGCCGLFTLSALMPAGEALPHPASFAITFAFLAHADFLSRTGDNPDPPPISLV